MTLLNFATRRENRNPPKFMIFFCVVTNVNIITYFDVLPTVHLSIILVTTNLMHKILFHSKFIIRLYMF